MLTDIHCHNVPHDDRRFILDCGVAVPDGIRFASVGIHPWKIGEKWEEDMRAVERIAATSSVRAVGECGFDSLKSPVPVSLQEVVFRRHVALSESVGKPLLLHVVKGMEHVMRLHKELRPRQPWVVHGFRGKPEQARQYINAGMYLSFGTSYNVEALLATPRNRLFLESDEDCVPLIVHYSEVASALSISIDVLAETVNENCSIFGF